MAPTLCNACLCCYTAIDFDNISYCCKSKNECLCLVEERNYDCTEPSLGCGCTTNKDNNECCKISAICCSWGLKKPEKLFAGANQILCLKSASSFPLDERYVNRYICAYCFLQCLPNVQCCRSDEGIDCPALQQPIKEYMNRESDESVVQFTSVYNDDETSYKD